MKLKLAKALYVILILIGFFCGPTVCLGVCSPKTWHILPSHIFWLPTWPPIPIIVP